MGHQVSMQPKFLSRTWYHLTHQSHKVGCAQQYSITNEVIHTWSDPSRTGRQSSREKWQKHSWSLLPLHSLLSPCLHLWIHGVNWLRNVRPQTSDFCSDLQNWKLQKQPHPENAWSSVVKENLQNGCISRDASSWLLYLEGEMYKCTTYTHS